MPVGPAAGPRTLEVMRRGAGDGRVRFRTRAALTIAKSIPIDQLNVAMTSIRFHTTCRRPRGPVDACLGSSNRQGNPDERTACAGLWKRCRRSCARRSTMLMRVAIDRSCSGRMAWKIRKRAGKNREVPTVRSAQGVLDRRVTINGIEWHWPTLPECMSMQLALESGAEKVQREGACQPVERGWG